MEFYVGQQKDEWRLHQDYSSLQYEGSFWYLFYGKRDFPDELLHSIEDDGFKAIVAEVNECIFFMHSFGSRNWERVAYSLDTWGRYHNRTVEMYQRHYASRKNRQGTS